VKFSFIDTTFPFMYMSVADSSPEANLDVYSFAAIALNGFANVPSPAGSSVGGVSSPLPPGISYGSGTSSQLVNVHVAIAMANIEYNIFFINVCF
jgi:hypothetical protein